MLQIHLGRAKARQQAGPAARTRKGFGGNRAHPKGNKKDPHVGSQEIIRLAKGKGVTIHAVSIRGGGGNAEQSIHDSQCREIAAATGGQVYSLSDAYRLAGEISKAVQH